MKNIICVIPSSGNGRSLPFLKNCLSSLHRAATGFVKIKILVVSANPSLRQKILNYQVDNFYLVAKNCSFSEMNNVAFTESLLFYECDYYLLLNDDARVEPNFFKEFVKISTHERFDLLNPLILTPNNKYSKIDSFGVEYFTSGYAKNSINLDVKTTLATACCLFIKTSFLKKLNKRYGFFFNPVLFFYLEDVELSIRAAAIGGLITKDPHLIAHHHGSLSTGKMSFFTIYKSYKHLIWIIIMTWPLKLILQKMPNIIFTQSWFMIYSLYKFGPFLYVKIFSSTVKDFSLLLQYRRKIRSAYNRNFNFSQLLSPYSFRVGKNFWGFGVRSWLSRYL